ncbi:MAG: hypothetical protein PHV20_07070 [Bacteroidales bacterium]|nr:hypothetical protein [Bacteroidales bacterium]
MVGRNAHHSHYGLDLNGAWNKMEVSSFYHYSRHPDDYHNFVLKGMENAHYRVMDAGGFGNSDLFLKYFYEYIKMPIIRNPNMLNKTGW